MGYLASELGISFACYSLRQLKPLAANQISRSSSISVINLKWDHGFMAWDGVAFWWVWGGWFTRTALSRPFGFCGAVVPLALWHEHLWQYAQSPIHIICVYNIWVLPTIYRCIIHAVGCEHSIVAAHLGAMYTHIDTKYMRAVSALNYISKVIM